MQTDNAYLDVLDECYFEVKCAFDELRDENVWKRPTETLLSIGEISGHIAYWEVMRLQNDSDDESNSVHRFVESPLLDPRFRYYDTTLTAQPSEQHLAMSASDVCAELVRIHDAFVSHFVALNPDLDSHPPGRWSEHSWRAVLRYSAFHVAYHTGQIYSVRHLLGENTPDN